MDLFVRMNRERKVTVIMVTHSSELARRAARRLRMRQGMLKKPGSTAFKIISTAHRIFSPLSTQRPQS